MKPLYIEFVNSGVANRFDNGDHEVIEMNKNLKKYPKLFYTALLHELGHDTGKEIMKDFWHDMSSKSPGLFTFMLKHISSWTQLLPFYWHSKRKRIVYDSSRIFDMVVICIVAYSIFWTLTFFGRVI